MNQFRLPPRRLIGAGVSLIAIGYVVLRAAPTGAREIVSLGMVAFYGGLLIFGAGVISWVQQPPAPASDEEEDDSDDDAAGTLK